MTKAEHWDRIYSTRADKDLSWTQPDPSLSLALIRKFLPPRRNPVPRVIDVGGGTSPLAGRLLDLGYKPTVLDISPAALNRAGQQLGKRASQVNWIAADITAVSSVGVFDLWHDRALFHFLTEPADRSLYVDLAHHSIVPGGHLVLATFALNGPEQCSGFPVERYSVLRLAAALGPAFTLKKQLADSHLTPQRAAQSFTVAVFERTAT